MRISSRRGFTLMEIILAITALGILITALLPSFTAYQRRGRDVARLSHMTSLWKMLNSHFLDKEDYPNHALWCVDETALSRYGTIPVDPSTTNDNGCGQNQKYAYGSSALMITSTDEFALFAKMENLSGGNFNTGSIAWLTGTLNQSAFTTLRNNIVKGSGQYYAIIK